MVTDQPERWTDAGIALVVTGAVAGRRGCAKARTERATEWLMLTSGTSGVPKIVGHTLEGLAGAIVADGPARGGSPVWATFYDIRRYGGLADLSARHHRRRLDGAVGPRRADRRSCRAPGRARRHAYFRNAVALAQAPDERRRRAGFSPRYVRLSGEIADQAVLDGLTQAFPEASIGHAYASTEAGVGFAVNDGLEGFPAGIIGDNRDGVEMKVEDGSLRIRSTRTAHAYVGRHAAALADADGFVDTGDMVELRGDRYHFVGRRGGIINIGGLKVHPEEIEAVINRQPDVRMSRAKSRRSPITGAIVVADVILADDSDAGRNDEIRDQDSGRLQGVAGASQGACRDQVRAVARYHLGRESWPGTMLEIQHRHHCSTVGLQNAPTSDIFGHNLNRRSAHANFGRYRNSGAAHDHRGGLYRPAHDRRSADGARKGELPGRLGEVGSGCLGGPKRCYR